MSGAPGRRGPVEDRQDMAVGVAAEEAGGEPERVGGQPDGTRRHERRARGDETRVEGPEAGGGEVRLPVEEVVRHCTGRPRPAVAGGEVLEELDPGAGGRPQRRDPEPRPEDAVEVLLLDAVILALPGQDRKRVV